MAIVSRFLLLFCVLIFSIPARAELVRATEAGLDQQYKLKRIFLFPSVDDLSGVLAPLLDQKLQEALQKYPRFELIRDTAVMRALSPDESTYTKVAVNETVHREAIKITKTDATLLLRTRTVSGNTEMSLDWRDAQGKLLYSETTVLPAFSSVDAQKQQLEILVTNLVEKMPFRGTVTGRTAQTITLDMGMRQLSVGDMIELGRLTAVQRHPLLNTVVGVDYVKVGSARIITVDRALSFAEITEEVRNEKITADNKVVAVKKGIAQSDPAPQRYAAEGARDGVVEKNSDKPSEVLRGEFEDARPRYGNTHAGLLLGTIGHTQTVSNQVQEFSAFGFGAHIGGEFWVTRNWILALDYAFQSANLSGNALNTTTGLLENVSAGSTSWKKLDFYGGYRMFPSERAEGISILFALGYQSINMDLPLNTSLNTGKKDFKGIQFRVGGDIAFNKDNMVNVHVNFQPFSSLTEVGNSLGAPNGASSVGVMVGWSHQFIPNLWGQAAVFYDGTNGSYENGNTISEKRLSLSPSIYYYF